VSGPAARARAESGGTLAWPGTLAAWNPGGLDVIGLLLLNRFATD
jgi:hypothetical protein